MARFSQNFTLKDIFNNRNLRKKLPLINYREKTTEDGKTSVRTHLKSISSQVYEVSKSTARPFYRTFTPSKSGDLIILSGDLVGDHDGAVDAVYQALLAQKQIYTWTANYAYFLRDALKESEKNARQYGIESKLYLRTGSMQEIEGMTNRQLEALYNDIIENILYGDNFPKTQKKWKVEEIQTNSPYIYEQRKMRWKIKVGE